MITTPGVTGFSHQTSVSVSLNDLGAYTVGAQGYQEGVFCGVYAQLSRGLCDN